MSEGSPKRKRRLHTVKEIMEAEEEKAEIKIIDGLRYVVPYNFTMRTYAKKRWFDQGILEVLSREFQAYNATYYENALKTGKVTVNDRTVPPDYLLRDHDHIAHKIHRHEPPILDKDIDIIMENDELLVVNKPPSIPIHTTGRYRHNTLLKLLEARYSRRFYTCHRLDRLTSGIIVLLKNTTTARDYGKLFVEHKVKKTYLSLCKGKFPEKLTADEPILQVSHKLGINKVDWETGKPAKTAFTLLHYCQARDVSLVLCEPESGRMHQIRVHLAHHGHPIPNDPIYSRDNWKRKSTAEFSAELTEALFSKDNVRVNELEPAEGRELSNVGPGGQVSPGLVVRSDGLKRPTSISLTPDNSLSLDGEVYRQVPQFNPEPGCPECSWIRLVPRPQDLFIYLHAARYEISGHVFVAPLPDWCEGAWIPEQFRSLLRLDRE